MTESAHEKHNRLAREFASKALRETTTHSELMVVIETVLLTGMIGAVRMYGVKPENSVFMIEEAVQRATERLAEGQNNG